MTSSNVSNMLFQVSNINVEMPDVKNDIPKNAGLFETTLKNVAGPNINPDVSQPELPKQEINQVEAAAAKLSNSKDTKLNQKSDDASETKVENVKETLGKVEEVVEKVKDVIEEDLDVTDEELEEAMETLGLTMIDLLDPQKLAQVVAELTGEDDSLALVMSEEFKDILDAVTDLTNQLFENTGITFTEVKELLSEAEFVPVMENAVDNVDEIPQQLEEQPVISEDVTWNEETIIDKPVVNQNQTFESKEDPVNETIVEAPKEEIVDSSKEANDAQADSNQKNDEFSDSKSQNPKVTKQIDRLDSEPVFRTDGVVFTETKIQAQFSFEEQIVALSTGETVHAEDIINQLVEQARVLNDVESTTMEMTLNPEGLGKIFMEVTQKGDEITAKIFTENDAVKQALESQMANLRIEMNQNSTKVTSIEVSVGTHEFERNLEEDAKNNERRDEQTNQSQKRSSKINLNSLDELSGLMTEEDILIAQMMKDNGNTLDFQA